MTTRQERVEALIREEISDILRKKVSDPRIGFISLTGVDLSPDFKNAAIHVSILGEENKKQEAMKGLSSATGFIQGELGHRLQLRTTPAIHFVRDDSIERGSRVLQIIHRIENEKRVPKNKRAPKKK